MHYSRMRTARLLTVSRGIQSRGKCLPWGGVCLGEVVCPRGYLPKGVSAQESVCQHAMGQKPPM